jgi:peptide/nickel transport system substrate-binding protein
VHVVTNSPIDRRPLRVALPLTSALVASALVACGDPAPTPPPEPAEPAAPVAEGPRDMLIIGAAGTSQNLIPVIYETSLDGQILNALFYPAIDVDFDCSIKKRPAHFERWEWREEGTVIWVKLREDLTWSDGVPVTADDIKLTFELIANPAVNSPRASYVDHMVAGKAPVVLGPYELEFHFTKSYDRDAQISHIGFYPTPRHLLGDVPPDKLAEHALNRLPIGDGPFKVARHEPGDQLVLEPNERFSGPPEMKPGLSRVVYKFLPSYDTRLMELKSGGIDLMENVLVRDADDLAKNHPEIKLHRRPWRAMDYLVWNQKEPKFADKAIRTALAQAVDAEEMIRTLHTSESGEVYARRTVGPLTPALCNVQNDTPAIAYDPAAARATLDAAGWIDTNGDGVREQKGEPFTFRLIINAGNVRRKRAAEMIQGYLKEVGVNVEIQQVASDQLFARLRSHDFEAAVSGWSASLFVDPSEVWHSKGGMNFGGYASPAADALIEKGLATADPGEAAQIWKEFQSVVYEDQPYMFLWWMDEIVALNGRFENANINILSVTYHLEDWEVAPDKVKYGAPTGAR